MGLKKASQKFFRNTVSVNRHFIKKLSLVKQAWKRPDGKVNTGLWDLPGHVPCWLTARLQQQTQQVEVSIYVWESLFLRAPGGLIFCRTNFQNLWSKTGFHTVFRVWFLEEVTGVKAPAVTWLCVALPGHPPCQSIWGNPSAPRDDIGRWDFW